MKIIDASFDNWDSMAVISLVQGAQPLRELFGKDWHTVGRWAVVDPEVENRNPILYLETEKGCRWTTSKTIQKKLSEYTEKAKNAGKPLPKCRFYEAEGKNSGHKFYAIYFEEQL